MSVAKVSTCVWNKYEDVATRNAPPINGRTFGCERRGWKKGRRSTGKRGAKGVVSKTPTTRGMLNGRIDLDNDGESKGR